MAGRKQPVLRSPPLANTSDTSTATSHAGLYELDCNSAPCAPIPKGSQFIGAISGELIGRGDLIKLIHSNRYVVLIGNVMYAIEQGVVERTLNHQSKKQIVAADLESDDQKESEEQGLEPNSDCERVWFSKSKGIFAGRDDGI